MVILNENTEQVLKTSNSRMRKSIQQSPDCTKSEQKNRIRLLESAYKSPIPIQK